jgi:glyoxylase-like metal-dependent hydrolase (beta-lactamase superfamily II)
LLSVSLKDIKKKTADIILNKASNKIHIGGVEMQLNFYGDSHFKGDNILWLPKQKILFTGDVVYLDRMLSVHPWSNPITWNQAYQKMRKLPAKIIVPGHGQVSNWKQTDAETGNYLKKLIDSMTQQAEEMAGVSVAVNENKNWSEFQHLKHYDSWHKKNLNRTYLKLESEM